MYDETHQVSITQTTCRIYYYFGASLSAEASRTELTELECHLHKSSMYNEIHHVLIAQTTKYGPLLSCICLSIYHLRHPETDLNVNLQLRIQGLHAEIFLTKSVFVLISTMKRCVPCLFFLQKENLYLLLNIEPLAARLYTEPLPQVKSNSPAISAGIERV